MSSVRIERVEKSFGETPVLHGISLTVPAHSLVTLLGPSGCGKTTLLRLVAGLEPSGGGVISIGERVVSDPARRVHVPAAQRRIGMVFQSYALWPHRRVWENVAHPLKVRKIPGKELRERVQQALSLVQLAHLAERFPGELSGGQQQRVALARAIVYEPEVLLLDEPLSNLDAKLRAEMRYEIRELHQRSRLTTIYVTHDQEEAFVISDHICLMEGGVIAQMGGALELYEQPQSRFVADFVGAANQLVGVTAEASDNERARVRVGDEWTLAARCPLPVIAGSRVCVLIRPEDVQLAARAPGSQGGVARVAQVTYLGGMTEYMVDLGRLRLRVREPGRPRFATGQEVSVTVTQCVALRE